MNILLSSYRFHPDVGGIETMTDVIATHLVKLGHRALVVTDSASTDPDAFHYPVVRRPSAKQLLRALKWADVLFQNNISVRYLWPLLLVRRPWVVRHATWIRRHDGSLGWQDRFKRLLLKTSVGIANSHSVAADIGRPCTVVHNPYRDDLFRRMPDVEKDRDIVFLGRLVSDKGPHVLLDSLSWLCRNGLRPSVSIIGDGPERPRLAKRIAELGLSDRVLFCGTQTGEPLVRLLNRHRIMVVPSLWEEPFGIVALEGAACGNVVVGSSAGGLPEAIGPCGPLVPKGDAVALGRELRELLLDEKLLAKYLEAAPKHLERHTGARVVSKYLEIIERCRQTAR